MQKLFRGGVAVAALLTASVVSAEQGELKLSIANGRVTLIAQDVPIRQILSEWARIGETRIVNGDKLLTPVTLELLDVPEAQALDAVLRSASGYVVARRAAGSSGASFYDRIMILPTSRPPVVTASASTPPTINRPAVPQPMTQMPAEDDDGEPREAVPGAAVLPPGVQSAPGAAPTVPGQQQPVLTSPRPGMLPAPQPNVPGNPYQPNPQPNPQQPGVPGSPYQPGIQPTSPQPVQPVIRRPAGPADPDAVRRPGGGPDGM